MKCDRRLPTCLKCEKRGFTCSGYGLVLKWDQGVASRGNLKGKTLPLPTNNSSPSRFDIISTPGDTTLGAEEPEEPIIELFPSSSFDVSIVFNSITSYPLQNNDHRRLLHHFDHIVAPSMAWAGKQSLPGTSSSSLELRRPRKIL